MGSKPKIYVLIGGWWSVRGGWCILTLASYWRRLLVVTFDLRVHSSSWAMKWPSSLILQGQWKVKLGTDLSGLTSQLFAGVYVCTYVWSFIGHNFSQLYMGCGWAVVADYVWRGIWRHGFTWKALWTQCFSWWTVGSHVSAVVTPLAIYGSGSTQRWVRGRQLFLWGIHALMHTINGVQLVTIWSSIYSKELRDKEVTTFYLPPASQSASSPQTLSFHLDIWYCSLLPKH